MRILNLTNVDKSEIKWELSPFPDGQQQIRLLAEGPGWYPGKDIVQIKSRLNSWLDLERVVCANQSLKHLGVSDIHLYVPYVLGARSDRSFDDGENNYLKHVLCPIINLQGFKSVTVLDPHSDVLEACLNGFKKVSNKDLVLFALADKYCPAMRNGPLFAAGLESKDRHGSFVLVSPDAGASKKIYKIAEQIGYKGEIITCSKDRDDMGRLTKCRFPLIPIASNKDIIIIDDICDGGGTFINIADAFRKSGYKNNMYLIVTHGIFSKGTTELSKYFDGIYCTNSYSDIWDGNDAGKLIKQLNVF